MENSEGLDDMTWTSLLSDIARDVRLQQAFQLLSGSAGDVVIRRLDLNDAADGAHSAVYSRVLRMARERALTDGVGPSGNGGMAHWVQWLLPLWTCHVSLPLLAPLDA